MLGLIVCAISGFLIGFAVCGIIFTTVKIVEDRKEDEQ